MLKDPYLTPYKEHIRRRKDATDKLCDTLQGHLPRLCDFAIGHHYFGLHKTENGTWVFREWAPNADAIYLTGDFSGWNKDESYRLNRLDAHGVWEIQLSPDKLKHGQLYQLLIHWPGGEGNRLPAWGQRMVQDQNTKIFTAQIWDPVPYVWKNPDFIRKSEPPLIYEAHVGMAQEEGKVGSYREFEEHVLPRVVRGGYNTLQLMAIQEHPYYGSFGYHVTNYFAASSRFGTPEELKSLIDAAHGAGLAVIMDIVHSHSARNEAEGLSRFDGTPYQYFHDGARGFHHLWDSRCFNYAKGEVLHFLLSNCRYWMEEYRFDGYRFDGVTSMLYMDHGLGRAFTSYDDYFNTGVDEEALSYLTLANRVIHEYRADALTIAEDVSGMPGLAAPFEDGGYGFDYRLSLGVPDHWIKLLKDQRDEDWDLGRLWHELNNRRPEEKVIGYVESHDQSIVGDKTTIFWLIDREMYTGMAINSPPSLIVDRGIALHKMIRLITLATCGGGYLTFIGNEFGHPEWVDFPREGNNWSYHYARRQWHLVDDPSLRYKFLAEFDRAMILLAKSTGLLDPNRPTKVLKHHESDRVIVFERAGLIFAFNFDTTRSYTDYGFEVQPGNYSQILETDSPAFGGFGRLAPNQNHLAQPGFENNPQKYSIKIYMPSRSAQVLKKN